MKDYLTRKRTEVIGLLLALFDSQEVQSMYEESIKEEGRKEGREEGREEGRFRTLWSMIKKRRITPAEAAEEAGMTVEEFEKKTSLLMSEKETFWMSV